MRKGVGECRTITLTANPDTMPGLIGSAGTANTDGNDTINGFINTTAASTNSTFTAADTVNGGTGTDTFNITVEGNATAAMPAATLSGVENFYIRDVHTGGGSSSYDFAPVAGEAQVWSDRSTANVILTGLATGTIVGLKGNSVAPNANLTFDMAKATDAVSIALDSVKNGTLGADTVVKSENGQATSATITTVGAASDVDQIELSDEGATPTIKDVTINANANLTIGTADGTVDLIGFDTGATVTNTITITGAASNVKLNDVAAAVDVIDASAFEGGVTADASFATLASFKGGKGNDTLTVATLTATGTVDLGAGNDSFVAAANVVKSTNSVDGGAGTDTFALAAVDASNVAKFSNFEIANLDSLAAVTYDMNLLAGKNTIAGFTTGTAVSGDAATVDKMAVGAGVEVVGDKASSGLILKVKDAATTTTDTIAVKFNVAADPDGLVLTPSLSANISEVETINVTSGGGALNTNTFTLLTTAMTQASATNKVTQTIKVDGANQLTLDVAGSAVANTKVVVDGSTATGKLLVTGSTTTTSITGGTAADTITVAAAATSVTGGAGKDTFVVDAATGATNITTITDASAGDIISTIGAGAVVGTKLGAATSLGGATDVATVLALLATAADAAATQIAWGVVGTDVYLVVTDDAGDGLIAGDNAIKLTGVSDLSNWTTDNLGGITVV